MALWKTMLLAGVVVLAWFFAQRYFDLVVIIVGVLWVTEYYRNRAFLRSAKGPSVGWLAQLLGIERRPNVRTFKLRWQQQVVQISAFTERSGGRAHTIIDLATPSFRKTPFCFVVRPRKAPLREAQLVENSRIPGARFEYALERVEMAAPLEAAANMGDLFDEVRLENTSGLHLERLDNEHRTFLKLFFNGRVLHAHLLLDEALSRAELTELLEAQVAIHLNLLDFLDNVNFKVPA